MNSVKKVFYLVLDKNSRFEKVELQKKVFDFAWNEKKFIRRKKSFAALIIFFLEGNLAQVVLWL